MLVHHRVAQSFKFTSIHLYTLVERGTVGLPKNATQCPRPRPGLLDPETSPLTTRPLRLPPPTSHLLVRFANFLCFIIKRMESRFLESSIFGTVYNLKQESFLFLRPNTVILPRFLKLPDFLNQFFFCVGGSKTCTPE